MEISSKKIRFAVIGYGHIGKRHAEMIKRNPDCELVAIVDIDINKKQDDYDEDVQFFDDIDLFLQAEILIDVVCIATPNGFHATQAIACLNKGKHVVIEKPMALNTVDANNIIAKAEEKSLKVFPVMQNRYSPPSVWMKKIVTEGKLGKIFAVQLNCYWNRDERYYTNGSWHGTKDLDGGTLFTQFSHFIDMMYWLFGDVKDVKAKLNNFNHTGKIAFEDSGVVTFDFEKEGTGVLTYSTSVWDKNFESSITVIGENGTVKLGGQYMNKVEYCHIKNVGEPIFKEQAIENDYGTYKGSAANHHFVFKNVVEVLNSGKKVDVAPQDAVKVIGIVEKIYQ